MLKIHQIIFHASLDPSISITGTIIAILPVHIHIHILILNNVSMKPTGGMMNCKDHHLGRKRNVDPFTKTSRSSNISENRPTYCWRTNSCTCWWPTKACTSWDTVVKSMVISGIVTNFLVSSLPMMIYSIPSDSSRNPCKLLFLATQPE